MRITSIEHNRRRRRYEVQVDFVLGITLSPEVFATAGLRTGQEISLERIAALEETQARHVALSSAMRLLAYRPRSEKEMRTALQRKGVKEDLLVETMTRLRETRLLDDVEFARSYVDQRNRTSPRSRRLLRSELRGKGVTIQAADDQLVEVDDADAAYRAASKRARSLATLAYPIFERRLGDFLLRRGFGYETSREAVSRLWSEITDERPPDER